MSDNNQENIKMRSFSLTIFLAFAAGLCFFVLMAQWHGPYRPVSERATTTGRTTP